MANADLSSILDDLAAGRIDTAEAGRRIEAAKRAAEEAEAEENPGFRNKRPIFFVY